ncbi:hypothetical protein HYC85_001223 [Camellia sinensis]|uniref:CNNM transmembrane domain-containing protein n=1 Tax=Camellia sinensis TaxID=4442 RepID=A0A7J7I6J0_CAMSI|nr:hypothetical protein HYC85_001223 [Camellia sinensis]
MAANDVPCCETMFWVYLLISVVLVAFAGLMSGLTLGLMSLSLVDLEVLTKAGQPQDRKNAEKILPIVKNQHLLLCTLLICNAMAMEALPIFLDALLPAWGAILISVSLILAFGEIIPQAVCSRYGLGVGAKLSVVVQLLVIVIFPIAYPIIVGWAPWKGAFCTYETGRTKDIGGHAWKRGGVNCANKPLKIHSTLFALCCSKEVQASVAGRSLLVAGRPSSVDSRPSVGHQCKFK